jgi:hypothetical protein
LIGVVFIQQQYDPAEVVGVSQAIERTAKQLGRMATAAAEHLDEDAKKARPTIFLSLQFTFLLALPFLFFLLHSRILSFSQFIDNFLLILFSLSLLCKVDFESSRRVEFCSLKDRTASKNICC